MGASVTPEKRIPGKKRDTESSAISPPRKDPISNQYINKLITEQYPSLPPIKAKYTPGFKPLFNDAHNPNITEDDPYGSTDNSLNENGDSVNKLNVTNNEDIDEKYKDDNSQYLNSNESVINKTE